jgi:hypothetical protein
MHVCQEAKFSSKVRCPICGQNFLIYAKSGLPADDTMSRRVIEYALRTHHTPSLTSGSAHPASTFHIRNWSGAQPFLASPAPGNLVEMRSNSAVNR